MAKDKIEISFTLDVDDNGGTPRDITGDIVPGTIQIGGVVLDQLDMSGMNQAIKNYFGGQGDSPITFQVHMNDTADTGAHTVLAGITLNKSITITGQWGIGGAAPTGGDPEWEGEYVLMQYQQSANAGRFIGDVVFMPTGATPPAWGTV